MRESIGGLLALVAAASLALPGMGQTTANANGQTPKAAGSQTVPCKVTPNTAAKHQPQPFTAEIKFTKVQTLANGATITTESTRVQALDSQNRSMNSSAMMHPKGDQTPIISVFVQDPVAGTQIRWDFRSKKATVVKLPPKEQQHGCWHSESGYFTMNYPAARQSGTVSQSDASAKAVAAVSAPVVKRPQPVMEDLGIMTIQGIEAHGRRFTTTTPAGEIGNDQPLVSKQENWQATGFELQVRSVSDDPQQGKQSMELVKLDQSEPDPALFQPPEGYEIVTEEMVPCKEP